MGTTTTTPDEWPPNAEFPFDLFVWKKHRAFWDAGNIQFTDSSGNLFFRVDRGQSSDSSAHSLKLILDASDNTLIRLVPLVKGSWQGFMVNDTEEKELMFSVNRTLNTFTTLEFDIFLGDGLDEGKEADLKMKGSAFKRSCTIYKGNSIVAETSLMYTLGFRKHFIPRNRFRVTIFPGFAELSLVVALVVIFFDKRKFWI
ncbi:PREDICTED: protein LURP-one-related 7-like isoform X1 [Nicotiana attenuata]|uniref:Protein lurp-one-related 7 n=1 Tax=Nicotiana attenuata TaxID=49451 RepID=A0A1J6IAH4_NICAT|nr:PREDICTED: protein LURP-one-related 7-like isoform X1 [Nicotiana attenuata]OIT01934.1 protein lurp-one-related 7 [Nicotiana attenuata]